MQHSDKQETPPKTRHGLIKQKTLETKHAAIIGGIIAEKINAETLLVIGTIHAKTLTAKKIHVYGTAVIKQLHAKETIIYTTDETRLGETHTETIATGGPGRAFIEKLYTDTAILSHTAIYMLEARKLVLGEMVYIEKLYHTEHIVFRNPYATIAELATKPRITLAYKPLNPHTTRGKHQ